MTVKVNGHVIERLTLKIDKNVKTVEINHNGAYRCICENSFGNIKIFVLRPERKPWSSGLGRRLINKRLLVRIQDGCLMPNISATLTPVLSFS